MTEVSWRRLTVRHSCNPSGPQDFHYRFAMVTVIFFGFFGLRRAFDLVAHTSLPAGLRRFPKALDDSDGASLLLR